MSRHCPPNSVAVKIMGCLQRSWNRRACSKLIWPIKNDKRMYDDFGALARYIIPLFLGPSPTTLTCWAGIEKEFGNCTCPERLLLISKRTRSYAMAREKENQNRQLICALQIHKCKYFLFFGNSEKLRLSIHGLETLSSHCAERLKMGLDYIDDLLCCTRLQEVCV